jgi:hypothetical protein
VLGFALTLALQRAVPITRAGLRAQHRVAMPPPEVIGLGLDDRDGVA